MAFIVPVMGGSTARGAMVPSALASPQGATIAPLFTPADRPADAVVTYIWDYNLDNRSGGQIIDQGPNGNNGLEVNTPAYGVGSISEGVNGEAFYQSEGASPVPHIRTQASNTDSLVRHNYWWALIGHVFLDSGVVLPTTSFGFSNASFGAAELFWPGNAARFFYQDNRFGVNHNIFAAPAAADGWHDFVLITEPDTGFFKRVRFYLDGVLTHNVVYPWSQSSFAVNYAIGWSTASPTSRGGRFDETMEVAAATSAAEISAQQAATVHFRRLASLPLADW